MHNSLMIYNFFVNFNTEKNIKQIKIKNNKDYVILDLPGYFIKLKINYFYPGMNRLIHIGSMLGQDFRYLWINITNKYYNKEDLFVIIAEHSNFLMKIKLNEFLRKNHITNIGLLELSDIWSLTDIKTKLKILSDSYNQEEDNIYIV